MGATAFKAFTNKSPKIENDIASLGDTTAKITPKIMAIMI